LTRWTTRAAVYSLKTKRITDTPARLHITLKSSQPIELVAVALPGFDASTIIERETPRASPREDETGKQRVGL